MGQITPKYCHKQEIAFEGLQEEWRPVDEWSEDLTQDQKGCHPPAECNVCCRPSESYVEEVLVVHHEALKKVDFLLRHDELKQCEAPEMPECVMAIRRAKTLKRILRQNEGSQQGTSVSSKERVAAAQGVDNGPYFLSNRMGGPPQPCQDPDNEDFSDPSDDEDLTQNARTIAHGNLEQRFHQGLDMWTLSRGKNGELLQEPVLVQRRVQDDSVLWVSGDSHAAPFPLATVTCVVLATGASGPNGGAAGEPGIYVYVTALKKDQRPGEGAYHFAFQDAQDAQDFGKWMRTFYPSQVVKASDQDPLP